MYINTQPCEKNVSPKSFLEIKNICIFEKLHIFVNKMFVKSSKHNFILMLDPNEHKGFELSFCYFKISKCSVEMFCWISS
jgi:hypothetical protein